MIICQYFTIINGYLISLILSRDLSNLKFQILPEFYNQHSNSYDNKTIDATHADCCHFV